MKKLIYLLCVMPLLAIVGCKNEDKDNIPPKCEITSPENGATLNLYDDLVIKGTASDEDGTIEKVILTVDGTVVSSVTTVPFEYTVKAEELTEKTMAIQLYIEDNEGSPAQYEIRVTITDQSLAPTCEITSPEDGLSFEPEDMIVIKGVASGQGATIETVTLKVNGDVIPEVTAVPFEYTLADQYKVPDETVAVSLEVEDNHGKTASSEITIAILGRERTFVDPRDNKTYKTVKLGTQEWFAENLAYLPEISPGNVGSEIEGNEEKPYYYVYGYYGTSMDEAKALTEYSQAGVLYNYWAVMAGAEPVDKMLVPSGVQGPCPEGWHVPTHGEWWVLSQWCYDQIPDDDEDNVTYNDEYGNPQWDNSTRLIKNILVRLKARNAGWNQNSFWVEEFPGANDPPTDEWGFALFPSGSRYPNESQGTHFFYYSGGSGSTVFNCWTPSWDDYSFPNNPGGVSLGNGSKYELNFARGGSDPNRAYSIRCVRD